ncbi:MAG: hypothetical protein US86_C0003G0096 [Candidatus Daviesbacteria bacterium GW2011_GWA2_38_24]|uniref:Uncharacterized protein n=1 Tax=Candidatus Daviesbacteria bacterium GW2011_GWA2_38_24 TaxID=1618422 RepID=A0A0G0JGQ8_9BACT|nr:MAG: hypothetical protein US86_C0003G0096 [Candidatus Daviesbacteria bacterium GW2011_GWA2_38_24]KKQ80238.1 MAG: hypothetical protein UT01_C0016G0019 [Candidatus Daviesbacteria bacterium GW2011_GWA1_38_7]
MGQESESKIVVNFIGVAHGGLNVQLPQRLRSQWSEQLFNGRQIGYWEAGGSSRSIEGRDRFRADTASGFQLFYIRELMTRLSGSDIPHHEAAKRLQQLRAYDSNGQLRFLLNERFIPEQALSNFFLMGEFDFMRQSGGLDLYVEAHQPVQLDVINTLKSNSSLFFRSAVNCWFDRDFDSAIKLFFESWNLDHQARDIRDEDVVHESVALINEMVNEGSGNYTVLMGDLHNGIVKALKKRVQSNFVKFKTTRSRLVLPFQLEILNGLSSGKPYMDLREQLARDILFGLLSKELDTYMKESGQLYGYMRRWETAQQNLANKVNGMNLKELTSACRVGRPPRQTLLSLI